VRGRGLACTLETIPIRLKNAAPDVALHFVVADLLIREVGKEHIEPAVNFLEITHVSSEFGFDLYNDRTDFPFLHFLVAFIHLDALVDAFRAEVSVAPCFVVFATP
jgi:hypothetical protein